MMKRTLSLLLAIMMVMSVMPMTSYATDNADMINTEAIIQYCDKCGSAECAGHENWCYICSADNCGKEHKTCDVCGVMDCVVEHKTCAVCGVMDCSAEHKTCAVCGVMDCTAEHKACDVCGAMDCSAEHKACDVCGVMDCTAEHKDCDVCGTMDCTADHANWCDICMADNCGQTHVVCIVCGKNDCKVTHDTEIPRIPMTSTGTERTADYSGDVGKYVVLNAELSSYTVDDGWGEYTYYPEDFTSDTIFVIDDWKWDTSTNRLWYQVEFYTGKTQGAFGY